MTKETKLLYFLCFSFIISGIIHKGVFALFQIEEAVFFLLSIAALCLFIAFLVYCLVLFLKKRRPKDLWVAGYLGLTGLLGIFTKELFIFSLLLLLFLIHVWQYKNRWKKGFTKAIKIIFVHP